MSSLSISAAWDETRPILARDGQLFLSVALALIVLPQVVLAVVGSPIAANATPASRAIYFAAILLGLVAQVSLIRLAIGPAVTVRDAITQGLVALIPVFLVLALALVAIAILAGVISMLLGAVGAGIIKSAGQPTPAMILLLLVLASLVFAVMQLVIPVAAAETRNPIRMVARAWQLARGNYWRLLAFIALVVFGLGIVLIAIEVGLGSVIVIALGRPDPGSMSALLLGLIAGLLQAGFTIVTAVMLARIYVQLAGRGGAQVGVPNSGI